MKNRMKKHLEIAFALNSSYEDIHCTAQVFLDALRTETPLANDPLGVLHQKFKEQLQK